MCYPKRLNLSVQPQRFLGSFTGRLTCALGDGGRVLPRVDLRLDGALHLLAIELWQGSPVETEHRAVVSPVAVVLVQRLADGLGQVGILRQCLAGVRLDA